jgi:hypothetical protein
MTDRYDWTLFAWAIDFVRCVEEFPVWRKWLLYLVLGKYAAREYVGLREHLDSQQENQSQWGYGIEGTPYHREPWKWIKE